MSAAKSKSVKLCFKSPFSPQWPTVDTNTHDELWSLLETAFEDTRTTPPTNTTTTTTCTATTTTATTSTATSTADGGEDVTASGVVRGLNAVLRAVQAGEVAAAVVARRSLPSALLSYLPSALCAGAVSVLPLNDSRTAADLGALVGLQSCYIVGIMKGSEDELVSTAASVIRDKCGGIVIPWIDALDSSDTAVANTPYQPLCVKPVEKMRARRG